VNIVDAYADPRFDKGVDLETGLRRRTLLSVLIDHNRGENAGVTEMINHRCGGSFDDGEIKMIMAFNRFRGLFASCEAVHDFAEPLAADAGLRGDGIDAERADTLTEIMNNSKSLINASRGTNFLRDGISLMSPRVYTREKVAQSGPT
jgi:hypothetical protein